MPRRAFTFLVALLFLAAPAAAQQQPAPDAGPAGPPPVQPLSDDPPPPDTLTAADFYEQLVGVPLCGTPPSGPLQGRALCTVHLPDGTAVVAGSGILVRGVWEIDDQERVCRRNPDDPLERRRCVTYRKLENGRYRNSDGIDVCIGPCAK